MGKKTAYAVLISTACGIAYAIHISLLAGAIGAGYAAKQICSGMFVARLPEQFVLETDVLPRLATVEPLAKSLGYEVNYGHREVAARMLGQEVTARHRRVGTKKSGRLNALPSHDSIGVWMPLVI